MRRSTYPPPKNQPVKILEYVLEVFHLSKRTAVTYNSLKQRLADLYIFLQSARIINSVDEKYLYAKSVRSFFFAFSVSEM